MQNNIVPLSEARNKKTIAQLRREIASVISVQNLCYDEIVAINANSIFSEEIKSRAPLKSFSDFTPCFLGGDDDIEEFKNRYPDMKLPPNKTLREICEMSCVPFEVLIEVVKFLDAYLPFILEKTYLSEQQMLECFKRALITRGCNFDLNYENSGAPKQLLGKTGERAMACLG